MGWCGTFGAVALQGLLKPPRLAGALWAGGGGGGGGAASQGLWGLFKDFVSSFGPKAGALD